MPPLNEAADDFDVPVPPRPAGTSSPAAPVKPTEPQVQPEPPAAAAPEPQPPASAEKPQSEDDEEESPAKPKRVPQDVVTPVLTSANMMETFRAQKAHAREVRLGLLAQSHPEVRELIDRVAELEAKLTPKKKVGGK